MNVPQGKTVDGFETSFGVNHLGSKNPLPALLTFIAWTHQLCVFLLRTLPADRAAHRHPRDVSAQSRRDGVVARAGVGQDALG